MKLKPLFIVVYTLVFFLFSALIPPQIQPETNDKFVVVLDAGHGGHDPGNLGNGYLEKEIALGIVLEAGKVLEANPDIDVVYTRKDDRFVDLYVRGEIANKAKADLFVSVHCDSHNSDAHGAGTFVLGLHANKQNFEIAKKENSVIYLEDNYETRYAAYDINSPESIIGLTIMQEEFLDQSILLGKMMQDNFTKNLSRKDRKVKQAGFIVLHQTFMPSVLVETGFLTNKNEGTYLNSREGQAEMGKAIADAIILYKSNLWSQRPAIAEEGENVVTPVPEVKEVVEEIPDDTSGVEAEPQDEVSLPETQSKTPDTTNESADLIEAEKEVAVTEVDEIKEKEKAAVEKELKTPQIPEETPAEEAAAISVAAVETKKEEISEKTSEPKTNPEDIVPEKTAEVSKKEEEPVKEFPKETTEPAADKVTSETKSKEQVVFKVQILASSKQIPLQSANFNGLSTISKEPYKNLFRYMYGNTSSYKQAKLLKSNADLKGYTTSFIVAYKDGIRIPVQEAVKYSGE